MRKLYRVAGYTVVANRWALADGRIVSGYPLGPSRQTRYQARKLLARLRRTMPTAHAADMRVQQTRAL